MENSRYDDSDSGSQSEFIDDSYVEDKSFSVKKKNRTVFVAESEESGTDGSDDPENESIRQSFSKSKSVVKRSSVSDTHLISSDDDASKRGSIRSGSENSYNNVVISSSSDEDAVSPELIPKRRPPIRPKGINPNESIIGRKTKKRIMLLDSDTENSIVIEHDKHKKVACLKETPLKIQNLVNKIDKKVSDSEHITSDVDMDGDDQTKDDKRNDSTLEYSRASEESSSDNDDTDNDQTNDDKKHDRKTDHCQDSKESASDDCDTDETKDDREADSKIEHSKAGEDSVSDEYGSDSGKTEDDRKDISDKEDYKLRNDNNKQSVDDEQTKVDEEDKGDVENDGDVQTDDDDGPDEDLMVMSRATRMSIMGVIPKDNDSDESDFIESDESNRKSRDSGSTNSLTELPDAGISIHKTPEKAAEQKDLDSSRISCSPFASPLHDITNELNVSRENVSQDMNNKARVTEIIDLSNNGLNVLRDKELNKLAAGNMMLGNKDIQNDDDDVTIIDSKPEIIALSSDDEDEVKVEKKSPKKSPKTKKSPKSKNDLDTTSKGKENIKQYLVPPSYPNQVVYVKKHVRENELNKLSRLQEDLNSVRYLLEEMDMDSLPDGGSKLIERLSQLESEVRRQGDKVANMVVEPDEPSAAEMANDGFNKGLSWEEIQKASNAVQPRMFGKQAMATHMAERNLILDRLRDLHESLASCPAESELATPPRGISSTLMPHQLHALAWLQWRETQRPCAGILADDMGLGKTITMIALIASDKERRIDNDEEDDDETGRGNSKIIRGGTLVVCPASLIQQWGGEVSKHCSPHSLSVCLHHGPARATQPHRLATYDLVVTTYNILQRDNEKKGVLMRIQWHRVILDEAHIVRNHKAATSAAVAALRARRRWCLTGTPVQNKDLDLFALLKFLRCTPFDELTMWKKWIDNKSLGGQERLSTIMRCILLRRTKAQLQQRGQLACLPARAAHQRLVTLMQEEMNVYQKVLVLSKTLFAQFLHQRAEKNSDGFVAPGKDSEYAKMHKRMIAMQGVKPVKSHEILVLLLRLRQVCCHCGLIASMLDEQTSAADPDPAGQDLLDELNKLSLEDSRSNKKNQKEEDEEVDEPLESTSAAEAIRSVLSPNNPVFELTKPSSKIQAVMDCLEENVFKNKGDKAVVVSQWTSVLRLVERALSQRRVRSVTLSGAVPVPARPQLIRAINDPHSDVKVMLLSLCAGGVGINLCGANHLLLLDPHWNPQLEEQAQDRIYRVGQKKNVNIYRFVCVDTVEQTIRKLQEAKLALAENVLTGAKNTNASTLSIEDLKMLFNMGQ